MQSEEERGPSWYDASVALQHLFEEYRVWPSVQLVRPVRARAGGGFTSWVVQLRLDAGPSSEPIKHVWSRPFGVRGAHKTAPAAVYFAVQDAIEWLEQRAIDAASQHRF